MKYWSNTLTLLLQAKYNIHSDRDEEKGLGTSHTDDSASFPKNCGINTLDIGNIYNVFLAIFLNYNQSHVANQNYVVFIV